MVFAQVPAEKPVSWFTPDWFQIGGVAWVFIGCLAIRMILDSFPTPLDTFHAQLRMSLFQIVVAGSGVAFAWFLIPQSHVYAIIVGLSCSGMAVQFYAALFQYISQSLVPKFLTILTAFLGGKTQVTPDITSDDVRNLPPKP